MLVGALAKGAMRVRDSLCFRAMRLACEPVERKPLYCRIDRGLVSFTFDDFAESAHRVGGRILEDHGVRGTFYAALGLMGHDCREPMGRAAQGICEVSREGHEIGCHTFSHLDCVAADEAALLADIEQSARAFQLVLGQRVTHFAYPYGRVSPDVKRRVAPLFESCRGIFPGVNRCPVDLALLRANRLYGSRRHFERARRLIQQVSRGGGWVIFYSHDISDTPSRYGCSPWELRRIVDLAVRTTTVLPVGRVLARLRDGGSECQG